MRNKIDNYCSLPFTHSLTLKSYTHTSSIIQIYTSIDSIKHKQERVHLKMIFFFAASEC